MNNFYLHILTKIIVKFILHRKSSGCVSSNTGMYCISTYSDMLDKKN